MDTNGGAMIMQFKWKLATISFVYIDLALALDLDLALALAVDFGEFVHFEMEFLVQIGSDLISSFFSFQM